MLGDEQVQCSVHETAKISLTWLTFSYSIYPEMKTCSAMKHSVE